MTQKSKVMLVLLIPVMSLLLWFAYVHHASTTSPRYQFSVTGYDPFDLLRGHYLTYQIDYQVPNLCAKPEKTSESVQTAYICLDNKTFSYTKPSPCTTFIKGICMHSRFTAGIEKFYISEYYAPALQKAINANNAKIEIAIGVTGQAYVTMLLINDKPWKEVIHQLSDEKK